MDPAVILDLDDTLFDHRTSAARGLRALVTELGGHPTDELVDRWEHQGALLMARRRAGALDRPGYQRARIRHLAGLVGSSQATRPLSDADCDRLHQRFLALYQQEWCSFPDALPTLRALREEGVPVAVLTNGPEARQREKVRRLGMARFLVGLWTSDRLGTRKPDPRAYLAVCDGLGWTPAQVLHVGDDERLDAAGACAAGLVGIHLDRSGALADMPWRIRGLAELTRRLGAMRRRGASS